MTETEAEEFCQLCIAGDLGAVTTALRKDAGLANAVGLVHPDHREHMRKAGAEGGWSALHLAAHYGRLEVVHALLEAGGDVNCLSENSEGNTPLMAAVAGGQLAIVQLLVQNGADPFKLDRSGEYHAVTLAEAGQKTEISTWFSIFFADRG